MELSPLAIAILQTVALIAQAVLYTRGKNAVELEKRDRGSFGPQVGDALRTAQEAMRAAERIDTEKYRALASLVEQQALEIASLKAQLAAATESIASLSNKLASRERADRAAEKKAAAERPPVDGDGHPAQMSLEEAIRRHGIPLAAHQSTAVPAAPTRPPGFGLVAR